MDFQTKDLLIRSIEAYSVANEERQQEMISHVEDMLGRHGRAINAIAYGFADHYVQAGRIFLRIYKQAHRSPRKTGMHPG